MNTEEKEFDIIYDTGQDLEDLKHAFQIIAAVKARCEKRMKPNHRTLGKIVFISIGGNNNELKQKGDWLLKMNAEKIAYGFRVKEKQPSDNREFEIKEILRKTDELCGNKSGNNFITSQINYDGQGSK